MPYTKTSWKDRVVEKPLTFTMQTNADGTVTLLPAEGTIVDPGTPITAAYLNNLEKQYETAVADLGIVSGSNTSGSFVKFPDGTMICYMLKEFDGQGASFFSNGSTGTSTPETFVGDFAVTVTAFNLYNGASANGTAEYYGRSNGNNLVRWGVKFPVAVPIGNLVGVTITMYGRWK